MAADAQTGRRPWEQTRWLLAGLVVIALAVRVGLILADPHPSDAAGTVATHGEVARNIVEQGEWFVTNGRAPTDELQVRAGRLLDPAEIDYSAADSDPDLRPFVLYMPGTALLLAGVWELTGDMQYAYLQVLQALIGAAEVLLVWWIAMRLFNRPRTALIAAAVYAVFVPLAALAREPYHDGWVPLVAIPVVALFLKAIDAARWWPWALALGAVTGVGVYFRPQLLLLTVVLALAAVPLAGARRALAAGLVAAAVAILMLIPWTLRNADTFDHFVPASTGFGQVLWQGLGESANSFGASPDDQVTERQVAEARPELGYGTPEYDSYLGGKARAAIADHPAHYGKLLVKRGVQSTVLLHDESWVGDPPRPLVALSAAVQGGLVLAALLGFVLGWRRYRRELLFLAGVVAGLMLVPVFVNYEWRYLAPALFAYMIVFALGADLIWERLSARRESTSA